MWHTPYPRHGIDSDSRLYWFGVHRVRCKECGKTLSFLPSFLVPYKHYSSNVIHAALTGLLLLRLSLGKLWADPQRNAACYCYHTARNWQAQFAGNAPTLKLVAFPRVGIKCSGTIGSTAMGVLQAFVQHFKHDAPDPWQAAQCALSRTYPPLGMLRAVLLPQGP